MSKAHRMALLFTLLSVALASASSGAEKYNPYLRIIQGNPFRLRPFVPDQPSAQPSRPVVQPPTVVVAGVTDVTGRKKALLEILESGKPVSRPVLAEGETNGVVQVLQINTQRDSVLIRIYGKESTFNLRPAKAPEPAPALPAGAIRG